MLTAEKIIEIFGMVPLVPEGGFITVTDTSDIIIPKEALPERYNEDKPATGSILFLVTPESFSRMHWLPTDETYHFYMGDAVEQLQLREDGTGKIIRMSHDIENGDAVQSVAPANGWHGTRLVEGGKWALLGTAMAPAYTDSDYIDGTELDIEKYPEFKAEILRRL